MNEHDSERIGGLLMADGMTPTDDVDEARVIVLNTCAIRENADNKLYGNLGHLKPVKDRHPDLKIVVAGCLAQKDQGLIQRKAPWVDVVVGTHALPHLLDLLKESETDGPAMDVREYTEIVPVRPPGGAAATRSAPGSRSRPGCDNACTFCIVPLVRGPQRSRSIGDILAEVQGLAATGVVEVTLLGQNVNTYGRDVTVPGSRPRAAVRAAAERGRRRRGIRRIRFTSPHPHDFTPDVIEAMAETPTVCEHIHFPLQSGSDRVLKAMRRSYRRERYLGWLDRIRDGDPRHRGLDRHHRGLPRGDRGGLRADRSRSSSRPPSTARSCSSTRPGRARGRPRFDDQVPKEVVQERFDRLMALQERIGAARSARPARADRRGPGRGRRQEGRRPRRPARGRTGSCTCPSALEPGTFPHARIVATATHHLAGELVPAPAAVPV